ncbi:hypothetical protein OSC27_05715 [Microbacterium sp. STN6]|uniref:hypothetical protein n=1 Tax=Microbacterium sp. STN6 TaxID=2995588 RepID=UPI002260B03E|nr:hypothetical protein [Microbacterium sp. STN6]MCX7521775.1 hypothetical protein [Microbacterium sp. STN6]
MASTRPPERDVVKLLAKALRQLGDAGQPEKALALGGQAWWALKDDDPRAAEHINGVMHYLATLTPGPNAEVADSPAASPPTAG